MRKLEPDFDDFVRLEHGVREANGEAALLWKVGPEGAAILEQLETPTGQPAWNPLDGLFFGWPVVIVPEIGDATAYLMRASDAGYKLREWRCPSCSARILSNRHLQDPPLCGKEPPRQLLRNPPIDIPAAWHPPGMHPARRMMPTAIQIP